MAAIPRRLIAVSWAMPPMLYPRAMQVSRLLKGLAEHGWTSTVITLRPQCDPSADLQDWWLSGCYAGKFTVLPVDTGPLGADIEREIPAALVRRFGRTGPEALWIQGAAQAVANCARAEGCDALITFAQPWSDHLVGLQVRGRLRGRPWLAHFSDPWVDNPYHRPYLSEAQLQLERRLEHAVVRKADALIFVSEETARLVMGKYPRRLARKVAVIPHGFDRELNEHAASPERRAPAAPRPLALVYTGQLLAEGRTPRALFEALAALNQGGALEGRLHVRFVGFSPREWHDAVPRLGLAGIVDFTGRVDYRRSVQEAERADGLLLIDAPARESVFLPSKLVDYLAFRKPIVGLTPARGASADLLRSFGYPVVEPDDAHAVAGVLQALLRDWESGGWGASERHEALAGAFDIRATSGVLAELLARAASARRPWFRRPC